jgi:putative YhbY family RNA-binding protein
MLRAKAHHLHPVVIVGSRGVTPAVLHEIDINLKAHELVKVRLADDDRDARERVFNQICADLEAAPVQHLGKVLTLWRPAPKPEPAAARAGDDRARASPSRRRRQA